MQAEVFKTHSKRAVKVVPGDPQSRQLRIVCRSCNHGWMSILQQRAKPYLIPLMRGDKIILDKHAQHILASWAAMAVMVAEHLAPDKVAVPQIDRRYLWLTKLPPKAGWKIWIGNYRRGNWAGYWVHNSLPVGEEYVAYTVNGRVPTPNTQITTFVVGHLYVHAFSSATVGDFVARTNPVGRARQRLAQIWPTREQAIFWPPMVMTDKDADAVAVAIYNTFEEIGRLSGT